MKTGKPSTGSEQWWKEKEVPGRCDLRGWGATKDPTVHRSQGRKFGKGGGVGSMG